MGTWFGMLWASQGGRKTTVVVKAGRSLMREKGGGGLYRGKMRESEKERQRGE